VQEAKAYVTHTSFPRNEPLVSGDGRHTVGTVLQSVHDRTVPGLQEDLSPYHTHTHTHTHTHIHMIHMMAATAKWQNTEYYMCNRPLAQNGQILTLFINCSRWKSVFNRLILREKMVKLSTYSL